LSNGKTRHDCGGSFCFMGVFVLLIGFKDQGSLAIEGRIDDRCLLVKSLLIYFTHE